MQPRTRDHLYGLAAGTLTGVSGSIVAALSGASGFTCLVVALGLILPICAVSVVWVEMRFERQVRQATEGLEEGSAKAKKLFAEKRFRELVDLANRMDQNAAIAGAEISRQVQAMIAKARQIIRAQEEAAQAERERQLVADMEKRQIEERLTQERERVRLEEEKRRERLRMEEEARRDRDHLASLKGLSCAISGGCWVTRNTGGSDVIRGMTITVYRSSVHVADAFKAFFPKVRFATDVLPQVERLRSSIASELVAKAETDIDGKYSLGELGGDRYVVFACWASTKSAMYWVRQLDVDCNGSRKLNLHNENATEVLNVASD